MELFFIIFGILAIVFFIGAFAFVLWETQMTPARQVALWDLMDRVKQFFKKK